MDKKTIISNLKKFKKIAPRSEWIEQNREVLLSHISSTIKQRPSVQENIANNLRYFLQPRKVSLVMKPLVSAVIVLAIALGGFATISAAKNSLPGDIFYSLKRVGEKAHVSFTIGDEKKARLEVEFASRRSEELNFLIYKKQDHPQKKERIDQTVKYLKEDITAAKNRIGTLKYNEPQKAVDVAKAIDKQTDELEEDLAVTIEALDVDATDESAELQESIDEAIEAVEKTSDEVVDVIVEKHVSGEATSSDEEIKDLLEGKINKEKEKVNAIKDRITQINEQLKADVRRRSAEGKAHLPESFFTDDLAPEEELETEEVNSAEELNEKITEADVKGVDASNILEEADGLLEQNDYEEVVDKIKESGDSSAEAEEFLEEIDATIEEEQTEEPIEVIDEPQVVEEEQTEAPIEVIDEPQVVEEEQVEEIIN